MESSFEENSQRLGQRMDAQMRELTASVRDLNEKVVTQVRQHPALWVVGAFAVGYLIARMARHA
jgi:hypothetical protein